MAKNKDKEKKNETEIKQETVVEEQAEPIQISMDDDFCDKSKLVAAEKLASDYKDTLQRLQAEFENYKKRTAESSRVSRNDGINDALVAMLPAVDSVERGIAAIADEATKNGLALVLKQMTDVLGKFDVTEIVALGETFNPELHYAVMQEENAEMENKVTEVLVKGYQRKNKVLRPAMVKVAK